MTANVKSVLGVISESLENAAGYALVVIGIYAVVFVDLTGGGSLWNALRGVREISRERIEAPSAARAVTVSARSTVAKVHEDRILAVFDEQPRDGTVTAMYPTPEALAQHPAETPAETAAAPADAKAAKPWKRGLKGELRTFTVYGRGEQTSSASVSRKAAPVRAEAPSHPEIAAEGSAARAGGPAVSRPGVGSRLSSGSGADSGASRNVR